MNTKSNSSQSNTIATGLALFSMFFGAGNVVFPLAIGQWAQDFNIYAILGLLITAVGVPILGVMTMTLYNGNYKHFFERIGTVPGFLLTIGIMGLIGPFGAIPRCIALSYSTINLSLPSLDPIVFSIVSCVVIYLFTFRKTTILDILGYVLTPFLLLSLTVIIVKGFISSPSAPISEHTELATFLHGFKSGYQTLDLIGAFFFSSVVLACLEKDVDPSDNKKYGRLIYLTLKAGCIAGFLLGFIYVGFSYVGAFNSHSIEGVPADQLIAVIANHVLGPYGGIVASIAVVLACLTTAIALCAVFAEFIHFDVAKGKVGYQTSLIITLILSFAISTLNFTKIAAFLLPILQICYPALIALTVLNLLHKLYHFQPVKVPVLIVFILSVIGFFAW